ncbi:MAG: 4-(cytidine 5'-diphospho)-2-C-methyl-D-erythritol kinase [Verrucomicrobiota bacterium]
MDTFSIFAPAKLNLFLAITGRRADGFHDLVSVVCQIDHGDTLRVEARADGAGFELACDDPAVPVDGSNLVLKAAALFARRTGWRGGAKFFLEKRVPMGAGLGGGSSDGVAALRALDRLSGGVHAAVLPELAAELGSDCPLFLRGGSIIMRGRGERVEALPEGAAGRLRGRRLVVFKPAFGISTPWAYGQLVAAAPGGYLPAVEAEARLAAWVERTDAPAEDLLYNNMETPAFRKFVALPALLERLRAEFGLAPRMSGSGSACFAFVSENMDTAPLLAAIRGAWGGSAFVRESRVL